MEDTLLIHDFLFISKLTYGPNIPFTHTRLPGLRKPKPGDVIVFQNPVESEGGLHQAVRGRRGADGRGPEQGPLRRRGARRTSRT